LSGPGTGVNRTGGYMAKQNLDAKTVKELREMAKRKGIAGKKGGKKKAKTKKAPRKVPSKKKPARAAIVLPALPDESRQDKMVSMPVSPRRVYVYWEIPEDKIVQYKGSLNLKISDVKTKAFFYVPISGRIGETFVNVNPGSDFTMEIGVINSKGQFVDIISHDSGKTVAPPAVNNMLSGSGTESSGAEGLPEEFFEIPDSVSSP